MTKERISSLNCNKLEQIFSDETASEKVEVGISQEIDFHFFFDLLLRVHIRSVCKNLPNRFLFILNKIIGYLPLCYGFSENVIQGLFCLT